MLAGAGGSGLLALGFGVEFLVLERLDGLGWEIRFTGHGGFASGCRAPSLLAPVAEILLLGGLGTLVWFDPLALAGSLVSTLEFLGLACRPFTGLGSHGGLAHQLVLETSTDLGLLLAVGGFVVVLGGQAGGSESVFERVGGEVAGDGGTGCQIAGGVVGDLLVGLVGSLEGA